MCSVRSVLCSADEFHCVALPHGPLSSLFGIPHFPISISHVCFKCCHCLVVVVVVVNFR